MNPDTNVLAFYPFPSDSIYLRMQEVLAADDSDIKIILDYLVANRGKMLRPRMVFLAASLAPHDQEIVRDAAVAVELIHMASLVHDDVIDQAMSRRGRDSLNKRWGNHASVLAGDYLFATAFQLINEHGMRSIMENITTTIRIMCAGEIKQMSLIRNLDITIEDYLQKCYGKTGCLFASSCVVGALAAGLPEETVYALEQYGLCLGYAYQIIDDLLDFQADSARLGKPVGNDLEEGNITLPVIQALQSSLHGQGLRSLLEDEGIPVTEKMPEIIQILHATGAIEDSLRLARQFIDRARAYLQVLPPGATVKQLNALAWYLLETYDHMLAGPAPTRQSEAVH
ncbi:MAG: polyprenyl synthetase family protein [Syntrophomonadaceae bacterium]